jgi:glucose-6-phosphate isomerase
LKAKKINKQEFFFDNKNIDQIKIAQKNAFIKALLKNKIPFREFKINSVDEQTLGELFSYFILETSIVGKLSKINPFDQPAVEQVKIFTKKLLS